MARDLAETISQLVAVTRERDSLRLQINEELNPTIVRLTAEKGTESAAKAEAERTVRSTEQTQRETKAKLDATETMIKELQAEVDAFPDTKAAREIEAERIRREAETTNIHGQQYKAAGLTGLLSLLAFGFLSILTQQVDPFLASGITGILIVGAFFAPQIINLIEKVQPQAAKHWRTISITASLLIGGTIASLGVFQGHSALLKVVLWTVEMIGFGVLFQGFFESIRILTTNETIEHHDRKKKLAFGYIYSFLGGVVAATIHGNLGPSLLGGASGFLLEILIGMSGMLGVGLIGVLLGWVGTYIAASLSGLFPRVQKKHHGVDVWLRRCKAVALIIAIVVGWIVGSGFAHGLTGVSNWVVAGVAWFGVSTVFFLLEAKVLEACFLRTYHWYVLVPLLIGATVFATGTAFLSFGKVYHVASQGTRFAEAQKQLLDAQNAFLAATESTCTEYANDNDGDDLLYQEALNLMKQGLEKAQKAETYKELATAAGTFQQGGAKGRDCASRKDRALLESVVVYPEPTPSDLSTQYWFGTQIKGVRVHEGSAKQAIVLVTVIDFLIVILSLFGWIFSSRKRQNGGTEAFTGHIISVLTNAEGQPTDWIVDIGAQSGLEENDILNVLNDKGEPVGSLVAYQALGNGAFYCRAAGKVPEAETGSLVHII